MKIWIVYREDGYGSYSVLKVFSYYELARNFVLTLDEYESSLCSIEEDVLDG